MIVECWSRLGGGGEEKEHGRDVEMCVNGATLLYTYAILSTARARFHSFLSKNLGIICMELYPFAAPCCLWFARLYNSPDARAESLPEILSASCRQKKIHTTADPVDHELADQMGSKASMGVVSSWTRASSLLAISSLIKDRICSAASCGTLPVLSMVMP